jgi:hypothetical protein
MFTEEEKLIIKPKELIKLIKKYQDKINLLIFD